jgi:hypothetical protein
MILHAMSPPPLLIAAGTGGKMTGLRSHYTAVTFRQTTHTGKAIALNKALAGLAATMDTINQSRVLQGDVFSDQWLEWNDNLAQRQTVFYGICKV